MRESANECRRGREVTGIKKDERDHGGREENQERGEAAVRNGPEHEGGSRNEEPGKRPLGSDSEGDGDAKQGYALPIPKDDLSGSIEGVGCGDSGKDESEGTPGGEDLRSCERRAGDHAGAEGKKGEDDVSCGSAVQAAGYVPERDAKTETCKEERGADEPAVLIKPELVEQNRVPWEVKDDSCNREQRDEWGGDGFGTEWDVAKKGDTAKDLICFELGEWYRGYEPGALRKEREQQKESDQVIGANGFGGAMGGHGFGSYVVTLAGRIWDLKWWGEPRKSGATCPSPSRKADLANAWIDTHAVDE